MFKVAMATLGCKVNQCESAGIAAEIAARGMTIVSFEEEADCCIINTCTVTGKTDGQARQLIRRAIRKHPSASIFVTGCYAQRTPEEIARIPGVHAVVGNTEKARIPELIGEISAEAPRLLVSSIHGKTAVSPLGATLCREHTRAFLNIQDGCNAFCSYCIVPHARGSSRSLPPEEVARSLSALAVSGYREVVLTGIHLGAYGRDLVPSEDLTAIVRNVADKRLAERLRLSSIEPREVTAGLITLMESSDILCHHLHIPLQSGDNGILAAMQRDYDVTFFRDLVQRLHTTIPDIAIGIDIMAGFPGETEAAFNNTLQMVEEMPIAYLHVFPFSRRPGTPAATMPGQVPEADKKRRAERLRNVGIIKRHRFAGQFIGKPLKVLIEGRKDKTTGLPLGFSDNYIPVAVRGGNADVNRIVGVMPESFRNGQLIAEIIDE